MRNTMVVLVLISMSFLAIACGGSSTKPVVPEKPEVPEVVIVEKEVIVTLGGVLFDKNSAVLKPAAKEALIGFSGRLAGIRNEILVEGHTDTSGTPAYNLALSQRRADSVAKLLVDVLGVDPARITAKGYGIEHPAFPNDTEANRIKNRRVEIILLPLNSEDSVASQQPAQKAVSEPEESLSPTQIISPKEQEVSETVDNAVNAIDSAVAKAKEDASQAADNAADDAEAAARQAQQEAEAAAEGAEEFNEDDWSMEEW